MNDWVPIVVVMLGLACANWTIWAFALAETARERRFHLTVCQFCRDRDSER